MKTATLITATLLLFLSSVASGLAQDPGWPRQKTENGNTLVMYQPQVDKWSNFSELDWRMAVSLTSQDGKPVVGVVVLKGDTQIEDDQTVLITNLRITETRFPGLDPARAEQMDQLTRTFLPPNVSISLQRLVACVPKKEAPSGVQLKNDPPQIFVSYRPAILLDVDGKPVLAKVQGTGLEYVVNTHWQLFFDPAGASYYLPVDQQWLTAPALQGPWSAADGLPAEMSQVPDQPMWEDLRNVIPPPPAKPDAVTPTVYFSSIPAEVLLFDGEPVYAPIPGTQLQYASNTRNYLFLYTPTNQYYFLTAGRWFSSSSLGGPWTFATPDLPADFAQIPRDSPAAQVLASVPGTEEAEDAVLMAKIPTTVKVDPAAAAAAAKVTYDGPPKFAPIEGTSLAYGVNTPQKVIQVGDLYYLCLQGIWFVATTPQGPWQTAPSVPQVIYTIPPSSPVYNVTYVTQTTTADGLVYSSYTAGYTGVYVMGVAGGAVIAGGTGYYYPPYFVAYPGYRYPIYYPPPYTYGSFGHYYSATGAYGVAQTAYGPYGSATRTASYNPYTGTYARTASVSTAYGSAAAGRAYNPYTGAAGATRQGANAYSSWGSSVVTRGGQSAYAQHYTTAQGTVASAQSTTGGRAYGTKTDYGSTAVGKSGSGDLYAGHDGNVYRNTGSGWQKYDNGSWNTVQKPTSTSASQPGMQREAQRSPAQQSQGERNAFQQQGQQRGWNDARQGGWGQSQGLQQEFQNRQRGEQSSQRFQDFQRSGGDRSWGGFGNRSWGGGGRSWGGGGGWGGGRGGFGGRR